MRMKPIKKIELFLPFAFVFLMLSCGSNPRPDFEAVFPQDKVNRIDIIISPENWQTMLDYMETYYGAFGAGSGQDEDDFWESFWPTIEWPDYDPPYVECTVIFEGQTYNHVGIRFKGSSTLLRAWWFGNYKIPFKLDFDEFEDEYPETQNQRFYGIKKLSFSTLISDKTCVRYKVAADLFREEGVPSPHTAFYRVFVDLGEGLVYYGLYTVAEYPQWSMFVTQFGDSGGHLYKPGSNEVEVWRQEIAADDSSFPEKTNTETVDRADVNAAVAALQASRTDAAAWRDNLEKMFDVYGFLKWMAVNNVIENWDVSGNHYLYGDPSENGRLKWIPWDFDAAFPEWDISSQTDDFLTAPLTIDMSLIEDNPLIRYVLDDEIYWAAYVDNIRNFVNGNFAPESLQARFQREHDLITPYVVGTEGELPGYTYPSATDFEDGLEDLFDYVDARYTEVSNFLDTQ